MKGHLKRNRMTQISASYHLPMRSIERRRKLVTVLMSPPPPPRACVLSAVRLRAATRRLTSRLRSSSGAGVQAAALHSLARLLPSESSTVLAVLPLLTSTNVSVCGLFLDFVVLFTYSSLEGAMKLKLRHSTSLEICFW